jgi:hypothetical protein
MKKFPVLISSVDGMCKRSVTMSQIEVLWISSERHEIDRHRKYFNLTMTFPGKEFSKAVQVKRLPNGYMNKFEIKK